MLTLGYFRQVWVRTCSYFLLIGNSAHRIWLDDATQSQFRLSAWISLVYLYLDVDLIKNRKSLTLVLICRKMSARNLGGKCFTRKFGQFLSKTSSYDTGSKRAELKPSGIHFRLLVLIQTSTPLYKNRVNLSFFSLPGLLRRDGSGTCRSGNRETSIWLEISVSQLLSIQ